MECGAECRADQRVLIVAGGRHGQRVRTGVAHVERFGFNDASDGGGDLITTEHPVGRWRVAHFSLRVGRRGKPCGARDGDTKRHRETDLHIGQGNITRVFDGYRQRIGKRRAEHRALRAARGAHISSDPRDSFKNSDVGIEWNRALGNDVGATVVVQINGGKHARF